MKPINYKILPCFILLLSTGCYGQEPTARITVQVKDIEGQPVQGAFMGAGSTSMSMPGNPVPNNINAYTDTNGEYTATLASSADQYAAFARKEGYYESRVDDFNVENHKAEGWMEKAHASGRWTPWERTLALTLRPIKNPVPMYVKELAAFIPELDKPCGYDLEIGDWVPPHGQGRISDFEFIMTGTVTGIHEYAGTLALRFPGEGNGIQAYDASPENAQSSYKMPYEAPEAGYQRSWTWRHGCRLENIHNRMVSQFTDESRMHTGFIFRVRSKVDATGKIIEARYGKIRDAVKLSPRLTGQWALDTVYYFNPDKTRNLEYDSKRNLFPPTKDKRGFSP